MLSSLNQASQAAGGTPPAQVISDTRTNSVLLSGPSAVRLQYRALIAHLDTPRAEGGDTFVKYLNYADAEDLATKLQAQFGAGGGAAPAEGAAGSPGAGPVTIWADAGTNAIVINAPERVRQDMLAVISQIDIPRYQVQVDAIIVELTEEKAAELGVTWALGSDGDAAGFTNFSSTTGGIIQLGSAASGDTPDPGVIRDGLTLGLGRIRDSGTSWAAIVSALRGDADTNIVSLPTIITLDNEEAEIRVGQEVPFLTGQFTNTGANQGSVNPFQTIQREEVGTSLKITPQINEGSGVKLTIEQETSSLSQGASGAVDLVTNTRTITTSVFVNDGDVLILGGLIDDQLRQGEQRVPGLGRIPGLGWLFRARRTEHMKSNLMVFIRPTILRDQYDAQFQTHPGTRTSSNKQAEMASRPCASCAATCNPRCRRSPSRRPRRKRRMRRRRTKPRSSPMAANPITPAREPSRVSRSPTRTRQIRRLPFAFAKRHGVLIQDLRDGVLHAIYRTGTSPLSLAEVRRFAGQPVSFTAVDPQTFDARLQTAYESGAAMTMVEGLDDETDLLAVAQQLPEPSDLIDSDDEAPIIRLINALLTQAVKDNASDIHIEPFENRMTVRFRIDGMLREVLQSEARRGAARRLAHQGHVEARHRREAPAAGRPHLAAHRGPRGRRARLDDPVRPRRARRAAAPRQAGRPPDPRPARHGPTTTRRSMDELVHRPHGILLVTGPTGSGKTTTLYAALERINDLTPQHPDGRGPDRVPHRRHRPDPGEHQGRDDLRARPARDPAPGPGRHHGRRDSRPRDRRDRGAGELDRPSRAVDAAHEHRRRRRHAAARHGRRAVPAVVEPDRRARAAPRARARPRNARPVPRDRLRMPAVESRPERPADAVSRAGGRARLSPAAPASTSS